MALTNAIRPILAVYGNQLTIAYRTGRAEHPGPQFIDSWDITTGQLVTAMREPMGTVNDLAFSPDGSSLAAASYGQGPPRVCLFDAQTGQLRHSLGAFSPGQAAIAFSADGKTLAVGEEPEAGAKVE
jgi:WD40 repeat protein